VPKRNLKRARAIIEFIEELKIPEGQYVGKPLRLERFQKDFITEVYGNPHGTRHAYLSIARKNGKSALIAAILLAHIIGPEAQRNSQVVSGARSRDQAALVWSLAAKMIAMCPVLSEECHVIPSSKKIIGLPMNVEFKALSADGAKNMGISPVLALLDEVGQVVGPTDYFTDSVTSAQGAHLNPLLIAISTQAPSDGDMFSIWLDDAARSNDPHTVCHLHCAPPDAGLMDESAWEAANPALGKFLNKDYLRSEMEKAERIPSEENKARNLYLNQRISLESIWLAPAVWKDNGGEPDFEVFRRNGVTLGLDLSQKQDLTVACLAARDDDGVIHVYPLTFTPKDGLAERARRDKVPYDAWARDGVLMAVPGKTVDYDWVCQFLKGWMDDNGIEVNAIEFDRWNIQHLKAAAERTGFCTYSTAWNEVGQGFKDFSPRMESMETAMLQKRVRHGLHPVLNLGAASAIAVMDGSSNRRLMKNKSSQKIDGIVAMTMAVHPHVVQLEVAFDVNAMVG